MASLLKMVPHPVWPNRLRAIFDVPMSMLDAIVINNAILGYTFSADGSTYTSTPDPKVWDYFFSNSFGYLFSSWASPVAGWSLNEISGPTADDWYSGSTHPLTAQGSVPDRPCRN
jgi:hypothetical protein